MGKRTEPVVRDLLSEEEVAQHKILIEDIEKQVKRSSTPDEKKVELRKQLRNLRSELWSNKRTKQRVVRKQPTYKGAEY